MISRLVRSKAFSSKSPKQKMRTLFLVTLSSLCFAYVSAQDVRWAERAGGPERQIFYSVAVDSADNAYVTGFTDGSTTFGDGQAGEVVLPDSAFLLAKYGSDGQLLWAKGTQHTGTFLGQHIAIAEDRGVVVAGQFRGTVTLGEGQTNEVTLESGGTELFLATYDSEGHFRWVQTAGGERNYVLPGGLGIALDGSILIVAEHTGPEVIVGRGDSEIELRNSDTSTLIIAKFSAEGDVLWARSEKRGGAYLSGNDLAVDRHGNVLIVGRFDGTATFASGEPSEQQLTSVGGLDVFVVKYSSDGTLMWAQSAGGVEHDIGEGIATDRQGHFYVTGSFSAEANFGEESAEHHRLSSAGEYDAFVAKFDGNGTLSWLSRAGGTGNDYGFSMAVSDNGGVAVGGSFSGQAGFGSSDDATLTSLGTHDVFLAFYLDDGRLADVVRAGGEEYNELFDIGIGGSGDTWFVGGFNRTIFFGPAQQPWESLVSEGDLDAYLARSNFRTAAGDEVEGIDGHAGVRLFQNAPNPFNTSTSVEFTTDEGGYYRLKIFDLHGRTVETLIDDYAGPGRHAFMWRPHTLASGVYVYQLQGDGILLSRQLVFVRLD